MDNRFLKHMNLCLLMDLYLNEKRALLEKKEAFEYEEVKGIFPGFRLDTLRSAYEESRQLIRWLEKYLLSNCPSMEELKASLGFN
jgi:hypothetical protein